MYVDLPRSGFDQFQQAMASVFSVVDLDQVPEIERNGQAAHEMVMPDQAAAESAVSPLIIGWWHYLPLTLIGSGLAGERYLRWLMRARRRLFDRRGDTPTASRAVPAQWHEHTEVIWPLEPATSPSSTCAGSPQACAHRPR